MNMNNTYKKSTLYESEKNLLETLRKTYPESERNLFVADGLCWADISNNMPDTANCNWPECLWTDSKRRVLFLLKEPNGNGNEDYKDWNWAVKNEPFGNALAYWLEGIITTTPIYCPKYEELPPRESIFKKRPLAIVNLKKIAGGSSANWNEIWKFAKRDKEFLVAQIRDILKPNIIVCCGSNDRNDWNEKVIAIALDCIFPDKKNDFKKINDWCYYDSDGDILLIDSYHPSYRISNTIKINMLFHGFQDFILKRKYVH